ncbi:MAG: DUF5309 domain-containing protein [Planctomycetes bacterium]|nr:DUF5309 domain-containing protein [Planctomycetota bacterium]
MAFTGKATYDGGSTLPELVRDVSDVVGLISAAETPLLDAIGDGELDARSTKHEWMEDALNPTSGAVDHVGGYNDSATGLEVADNTRFRVGDMIQPESSSEVMLITAVASTGITVTRGYGGTSADSLSSGATLEIISFAALEGDDAPSSRETTRSGKSNYTQIFTEAVKVSGSMNAADAVAVASEFDYQVMNRMKELLRQLERTALSGVKHASTPIGSSTVRRTMQGIIPSITAGIYDASSAALTEAILNAAIRAVWELGGRPNAIVVGGFQKRKISSFISSQRSYTSEESFLKETVGVYESDFGMQRVILSRWVPADTALLLDLTKIKVVPLRGRNFQLRELAATGDFRHSQLVGEYTLEIRNAADGGHGKITNLATS